LMRILLVLALPIVLAGARERNPGERDGS
jgi:hypothetical protein